MTDKREIYIFINETYFTNIPTKITSNELIKFYQETKILPDKYKESMIKYLKINKKNAVDVWKKCQLQINEVKECYSTIVKYRTTKKRKRSEIGRKNMKTY